MHIDNPYAPLVSVIIPVFNGEAHIRETIESVLKQDYKNIQLIVVDDGSTDNTSAILDRYRERALIISQKNAGPGAARNNGIGNAAGEIIAFLDGDDLWTVDNISQHVAVFKQEPTYDAVLGRTQCIRAIAQEQTTTQTLDDDGTPNSYLNHELSVPFFSYLFGAVAAKKQIFQTVGLIDEQHHLGEDVDWFLRVRESNATLFKAQHIALHYRRHEKSLTHVNKENSMLRVLKESLDRRRLSASDATQGASLLPPAVEPVASVAKRT